MTNKAVVTTIILILYSILSQSQVSDSLFELLCQHEDIIILDEDMKVTITGKKTYLMTATVEHNQTIIVRTTKGLEEINPYMLPIAFDDLFINHSPSVRNTSWSFENVDIRVFNPSLIHGNTSEKIDFNKEIKSKRVINMEGFFGQIHEHEYYLENLQSGDTLKLTTIYDIPFRENWIKLLSNRMFFHGKYPKKNFNLTWCYNKHLEVDSVFINHEPPELIRDGNRFCYNWSYKNLPGNIDEAGSRAYKTLPYFVFVPQSYDFEYTHYNSYVQEFIPPYFLQSFKREDEIHLEYWDNVIGNKNKNNLQYQKISDRISAMAINDSLGFGKMRYFQRFMVDSVEYDPAIPYYSHEEDHIKQRAGVDLYGHKVADNNIERVYGNMIYKLGLKSFTAYPVDNRVGEISPLYNATVKDNDLLFAIVLNDNTLGYVIPKSDKNFYYFEELPFYYEEIPVLLLHYSDYPNRHEKRNFNTYFRQLITPSSKWKDNYRKTQSKVAVNLKDNNINFQTRVILSGQYSTLTRNIYLDRPIDSTINPKYNDLIWDINEDIKITKVTTEQLNIYYPYKTTISCEYSVENLIKEENNRFTLDLDGWFKMIYWDNISSNHRFLDYYPDFVGSDTYTYMLEFNEPIKMLTDSDTIYITNKYGHISLLAKQMSDNQIVLSCRYSILSKEVPANEINLVEQINNAISKLNRKKLVFEIPK